MTPAEEHHFMGGVIATVVILGLLVIFLGGVNACMDQKVSDHFMDHHLLTPPSKDKP